MKCTGISKVDCVNGTDVLLVTIDDCEESYWFYSYTEALKYLNKDVIVEYRQDIYKGALHRFIATFVLPVVVTTLDRREGFKLFIDQVDNYSNVSFNDVAIGETLYDARVFCVKSEYKSSANAVWLEMLIRDKSMHVGKLRLFDYDRKDADFTGRYILTELSRNKYGFQTAGSVVDMGLDCKPNPEIELAKQFISTFFAGDTAATSYIDRVNLIEKMRVFIDYEAGYGLMRLAMELSMTEMLYNITNEVDVKAITHALLASYGYVVRDSKLSKSVNNVMLALRTTWDSYDLVIQLLDESLEDKPCEAQIMHDIRQTVDSILRIRKGLKE